MASHERVKKVSEQIRRELVSIIPEAIYHDKIVFLSVTAINLTRDFKYADIFVTLIGNDEFRDEIVELLNEKAPTIRHLLAQQLTTRTVPAMIFKYDESIEYGANMDNLLTDLVKDIPEDESAYGIKNTED